MVAYSFKPSFIADIQTRTKRQTIRLPRKRHARQGEALQFFTGPRMKPVRIGAASCVAVRDVRLDFVADTVSLDDFEVIDADDALDAFAVRDGFQLPERFADAGVVLRPWTYMARWWRMTHPDQPVFRGILIDWNDSFEAIQSVAKGQGK